MNYITIAIFYHILEPPLQYISDQYSSVYRLDTERYWYLNLSLFPV